MAHTPGESSQPASLQVFRAAPASEALRRSFVDTSFDDSSWAEVPVPGNWQSVAAFADEDGPLLYRTKLPSPTSGDATSRHWLLVEGVHNAADIWFDSAYLGHTEGYFVPHHFEITEHVSALNGTGPGMHCIGVEAMSSTPREPGSRAKSFLGIFDDAEVVGPTWNAGGITRPISIVTTGEVRLWDLRLVNVDASAARANIRGGAALLCDTAREVTIVATITAPDGTELAPQTSTHHLSAGETLVEWNLTIDQPELWWPHALGDQPLYTVRIDVVTDGTVSDTASRTMGMRSITFDNWQLHINGERLFVKGAVHWPTQRDLAESTGSAVAADITAARELGLDMLRVHTHVARPELYEAADRAGILLWQDFPLSGRAARFLRTKAAKFASHMVSQLMHHPSVVMWCAHNDPTGTSRRPDQKSSTLRTAGVAIRQEAPSWNKSVLDRTISNAMEHLDPSRPVIPHSGAWPSPPLLDGTDSHLWFGWATGTGRDLASFARSAPRMMRWVGAFGAQSVPENAPFNAPSEWPDLQWSNLQGEFGLDRRAMAEFVPTADYADHTSWVIATQEYQATLLRRQIEFLRSLKFAPTGGFCFTSLADCRDAISFAVLDGNRQPKKAFAAVKAACRPVIVIADRVPPLLTPGETLLLGVYVISDLRHALPTHRLSAKLTWAGGNQSWHWDGQIPADDAQRVGNIEWQVPDTVGPLTLELRLSHPDGDVERTDNHYQARIETAKIL